MRFQVILKNFASGHVSKIAMTVDDREVARMIARRRNEREGRQHRNAKWAVREA